MHPEFTYYSFFLIHLDLKLQIRSYTPVVPSKTIADSRPKCVKSIPVFTIPFIKGGTYLYGLYKRVPPPPGLQLPFVTS